MQLRTILVITTIAVAVAIVPTANAAECTKDQQKEMDKLLKDDPALDKTCPDNSGGSSSFDFETNDPKAWAKISPCKDASCVTYLKAQIAKIPTCEVESVNMKDVYEDKLTLCVDLASGKLTADEIAKRVGNVSTDGGGSTAGSNIQKPGTVKVPSGNATTTAPTPTPTTKKSGATGVATTVGAVVVASLLASLTAA